MRLNDETERYYRQACGLKSGEIDRWFQAALNEIEMLMHSRGMARSGIRNKAIEELVIERWRRLVGSRIECWLETYEQFEIKLEEDDVDNFVEKLEAARSNVIQSVINHMGEGGASLQFTSDFDQINKEAALRLAVERTKLEQRRKRIGRENKMKKKGDTNVTIGSAPGSSIQVGGKGNVANVSNTQLNQTLKQLREAFEQSSELDDTDREQALRTVDKLSVRAGRHETPKRLEKIKNGIASLVGIASKTTDLALVVVPLIEKLKEHWHNTLS